MGAVHAGEQRTRPVPAVERAVLVLRALGREPRGRRLSELARELGLAKSTLSGLLATLEQFGLVERDPGSRAFRIGDGLAELGDPPAPAVDRSAPEAASDGPEPARRAELIRGTYRLIGERGVYEASLREIAQSTGLSKGLIPYYFETKENLVLATMRWALSETAERIRRAMAAATTPEDKVGAMVDAIFVEAEANRRFHVAYLDLVGHAARDRTYGELSATFAGIVNSLHAEVIREGVAAGAFAVDDVDEAAMTVRAIVDGLFVQWLQEDDWRGRHVRYREICKRAVLRSLGAREEIER